MTIWEFRKMIESSVPLWVVITIVAIIFIIAILLGCVGDSKRKR